MTKSQVLIIGAGLGGLCLAQSLRRAGIPFSVYERDSEPFARPQGYRLHLDGDALGALAEVLSPVLFALFEATAQTTLPFTTLLATDLSVVKRLPTHDDLGPDVWPSSATRNTHANVDRATLRQILLADLDIRYGKRFERYEVGDSGVIAHFDDGTVAQGQVLVGADGIRSAVRRQRAPHADTLDAGVTAIYGRIPLTTAKGLVPVETLEDIFTIAADARKVFLGLGSVRFPTPPAKAAARIIPSIAMRAEDDYVVCIVGGRHGHFPAGMREAPGPRLQEIALEVLSEWPAAARSVVGAGDPSAFFAVDMFTSVPVALDRPDHVTLIGDAIHAMTPTLGRGANVAMRDGALLGRALREVAEGRMALGDALAGFERQMLDYGFAVVRDAARIGEQRMGQNPLME